MPPGLRTKAPRPRPKRRQPTETPTGEPPRAPRAAPLPTPLPLPAILLSPPDLQTPALLRTKPVREPMHGGVLSRPHPPRDAPLPTPAQLQYYWTRGAPLEVRRRLSAPVFVTGFASWLLRRLPVGVCPQQPYIVLPGDARGRVPGCLLPHRLRPLRRLAQGAAATAPFCARSLGPLVRLAPCDVPRGGPEDT